MSDGSLSGCGPRVGFLIVGAQKAGTTALHELLSAHPGLYAHPGKELHFFDRDSGVDWDAPDYSGYERSFAAAPPEAICGEATPVYMFHPPCAARIRAYNPAMRLIVILRNPVERAHSHWWMEVSRGREGQEFAQAIRAGRHRVAQDWRTFSYVERGFYAGQIRRLHGLFPPEQCLILTTEELQFHHAGALTRIWSFLGRPGAVPVPAARMIRRVVSADLSPMQDADARYLRALYRQDILETQALSGCDLAAWLDVAGDTRPAAAGGP